MSFLTLSKRILSKDAKKAPAQNKKLKSTALRQAQGKLKVDAHALITGRIGLSEIVSEKGILQQAQNTAVFKVLPSATKKQIAVAIESRYGVNVLSVRTLVSHPRKRRRGNTEGVVNKFKKAYVTVDNIQALAS